MIRSSVFCAGAVLMAGPAAAQDSVVAEPACAAGTPGRKCGTEVLTNYGIYGITATNEGHGSHLRVAADWGPLVSVSRDAAVGATFFASIDADGLLAGPAVRYRRQLADPRHGTLEFSVGVPLVSSNDQVLASPYGMVKWNPARGYGLVVRPELRRRRDYDCDFSLPVPCGAVTRSTFALSAGVEFSGIPGMIATGATAVGVLALLIAYVRGSD